MRPNGLGPALVGAGALEPGEIITGVIQRRTNPQDAGSAYYVGWIDSLRLSQLVYAPLCDFDQDAVFPIRSTNGYQDPPSTLETRRFAHFFREHPEVVVPPVLLSGRARWVWRADRANRGEIHVFDSAAVVDGRRRIGGYSIAGREAGVSRDVAFVLLPAVDLTEERRLHILTRAQAVPLAESADVVRLPDSHHPERIVISTEWTDLEILSEPYVVAGFKGYAVMLDVRELESGSVRGLDAGASSLSQILEQLRIHQRSIVGMRIRLRKDGKERYAQYEMMPIR